MSIDPISSSMVKKFSLINIYGKSGTGKTTYALQLLSEYLPRALTQIKVKPRFVWVQGSEKFPKKRLIEMYKSDPKILHYLQSHILLYPPFLITNYDDLCGRLIGLSRTYSNLPFSPTALIIDNISHYLRLELSKHEDVSLITALMDEFFDTVIVPLTFYCGRNDISLILVHEVTYNPKLDETVMFNHNLFSNLKSLNIKLEKDLRTDRQTIKFSYDKQQRSFQYRLRRTGIRLVT